MNKKRIAGKINRQLLLEAQKKLDEVILLLKPCFEILAQPELWAQEKIDANSIEFLDLSRERARGFPEMFSGYMNMDVFNEDCLTVHELWRLSCKLDKLKNNVNGTVTLTGNHAMETALNFYKTIKIAARRDLPGTRVLLEELRTVYPPVKRRREKGQYNSSLSINRTA
jgi:hypothetical protein